MNSRRRRNKVNINLIPKHSPSKDATDLDSFVSQRYTKHMK